MSYNVLIPIEPLLSCWWWRRLVTWWRPSCSQARKIKKCRSSSGDYMSICVYIHLVHVHHMHRHTCSIWQYSSPVENYCRNGIVIVTILFTCALQISSVQCRGSDRQPDRHLAALIWRQQQHMEIFILLCCKVRPYLSVEDVAATCNVHTLYMLHVTCTCTWHCVFVVSRAGDEIEVSPQCAELMFTPKSRRMTVSDGMSTTCT